jgi:hypothetical protein
MQVSYNMRNLFMRKNLIEADDPLAISGDIVGRVVQPEANSAESFRQMRQWFQSCQDNHTECRVTVNGPPDGDQIMPTRVIDIGSADGSKQPYLLETNGAFGQYAALSYCWGTSPAFTTRQENYGSRCRGFSHQEMPKTLQDALIVTRELGLRYLWIDALCIIQGDAKDWAIESSKMATVYWNAVITISAASSKDTTFGCLVKRWLPEVEPVCLSSSCSGSRATGTMLISLKRGSTEDTLNRSPLNKRGWTLQERILSRRILQFAEDQMHWECQKHNVAEDGTVMENSYEVKRSLQLKVGGAPLPWKLVMRRWHIVVTEYTKRDLSHLSDKLPAMSGLADLVHRETGAQYLAGLWMEDMPYCLLWSVAHSQDYPTRRAATWRAPSWSWVSIDGRIDSQGYRADTMLLEDVWDLALVLDHQVIPAGANQFGEVTKGVLKLRLRRRRIKHVERTHYARWTNIPDVQYPLVDDTGNTIGAGVFDSKIDDHPENVDCLLICTGRERHTGRIENYVLLAQACPEENHFFRLGVGIIHGPDYLSSSSFVDIFLV